MLQNLPESDPTREKAQIIVQQVARLEKILEQMLVYLKPFEIVPAVCSLNDLILQVLDDQRELFAGLAVRLDLNLSAKLPLISLDQDLIKRALANILIALLELCQSGQELEVRTHPGEHAIHLELSARGAQVSEDDLEHFFYPFATPVDRPQMLDLPMAKMIIHKHQGLVDLQRKDRDTIVLSITLPMS
jgi:signal transduction histidine kinase